MHKNQQILDFLNSQTHVVLGTINRQGQPQGATVGFGQTKNFEIIFGTDKTTRKAKNLQKNSRDSLTFNGQHETLQYEGIATLVSDDERERIAGIYIAKVPDAFKYYNLEN